MFSDISGVRTALAARLRPALPSTWKIEPALKEPPPEFLRPLLVFEFTRIDAAANGEPLPPGTAAAGIDLILGTPQTTEGPAEDDVDELALTLVKVVDAQPDIFWSSAEKQRLVESGQWLWRIHTTVLTKTKE
jgi:hypothetical protein